MPTPWDSCPPMKSGLYPTLVQLEPDPNLLHVVRTGLHHSLAVIAREEGAAALYKGFVPKVLRLAPGGGVLLLVVSCSI